MPKKIIEIASEIVQAQVSVTSMTAADIASSLRQVFNTLHELQNAEIGGIELSPTTAEEAAELKLTPQDSIKDDKVICLECGSEFKQLTKKHLAVHGMNGIEYRKKYGFTMKTPLAARSVIKLRSKAAKKRGLPENLKKFIEARRQAKARASKPAAAVSGAGKNPRRTRLRKKKA